MNDETRPQGPGSEIAATASVLIVDAGCPCGCRTRLPYADDPDCVRHLPVPKPRDWGGYDVAVLGLVPHDRELCELCQAVGR